MILENITREAEILDLIRKISPLISSGSVTSINRIAYTSDDTYTKPTNLIGLIAICVGGGGAGGGQYSRTNGGGGGGGGATNIRLFLNDDITDDISIVIGAGGTGTSNTDGTDGENTVLSVGVTLSTNGGKGGKYPITIGTGGAGGTGDINGGAGGYGRGGSGYGDEGGLGFYGIGNGGSGGAEIGAGGGEGCAGSPKGNTSNGNNFLKKDAKNNTGCGGGGSGAGYYADTNASRGGHGGSGVAYFIELLS